MAPGPGGTLETVEFRPLAGQLFGVLDLGGDAPTIVTVPIYEPIETQFDEGLAEVEVLFDEPVRLRSARARVITISGNPFNGVVTGFRDAESHRHVQLSGGSRDGSVTFIWDLDDPCEAPQVLGVRHTIEERQWLWGIARWVLVANSQPADKGAIKRYVDAIIWVNHFIIGPDPNVLTPGDVLVLPILW